MERMLVERRRSSETQANTVGETEKTGDVNWIMMVQNLSVGQSSTDESETRRCSGASVSFQKRTRVTKFSSMQSQIALFQSHKLKQCKGQSCDYS